MAEGLFDLGHHRPRLDRGDGQRGRLPRRAALLQGHRPAGEHRAGRGRRLHRHLGHRPAARPAGLHRVPRADPPVPGEAGVAQPEILLSYGATEAKVPDIADAVVEITETGRALRAAGLKVIETILVSHTELIANPPPTTTRPSATPWASSTPSCRARWRPGARCW